MKIEKLRNNHKRKIIIGGMIVVGILSAIVLTSTRAKYKITQSINIVNGTVNYKPSDFQMIAMYQANDNGSYTEINTMPSSGYVINESKSYCNVNNTKDTTAKLYTNSDGEHVVANISKNSKCYVYFDKFTALSKDDVLAKYLKAGARPNFELLTEDNSGKVFNMDDDDGTSYYFAGAVNDNYVRFADCWWRIIRFNGDGTIRLIYNGAIDASNPNVVPTEDGTRIGTSKFNAISSNNKYVGYRYTSGNVHGTGTASTIQGVVDNWYRANIVDKGYSSKVDINAGFCGDRDNYTDSNGKTPGGGTGTTATYYGGYVRNKYSSYSWSKKNPSYNCKNNSDLYTVSGATKGNKSLTYPVGLITVDEAVAAGTTSNTGNENISFYLYTGNTYWTMSPSAYYVNETDNEEHASMFVIDYKGGIGTYYTVANEEGVRPVINLKADTKFQTGGDGTAMKPFVVI